MANKKVSTETIDQALKIAKGTARPGQTKEQTKLIAQGIEKGIAEYKKREKAKARERDKAKKKQQAERQAHELLDSNAVSEQVDKAASAKLPWLLLVVSWVGFISYFLVGT